MKFGCLTIAFAIVGHVAGDPGSPYCCKPGQGVLSDEGDKCVDIDKGNVTSATKLKCKEVDIVENSILEGTVTANGELMVPLESIFTREPADSFCVSNGTITIRELVVVLCEPEPEDSIYLVLLSAILGVSSVFLTLTALVYCALPKLRDLQGKSIINLCGSLAIGLALLAIFKLTAFPYLCTVRGFFLYFFLLASFFWMHAIAIQVLLHVSQIYNIADYRWKPFLWYALYAWGTPTVITAMAIVNFQPSRHEKHGIGLSTCWFFSKRQQWDYMYIVMTILIITTIHIFCYIAMPLCCHFFSSSHLRALRYKFSLVMTVRMFIVMVLPWIFELISSFMSPYNIIWAVTEIFNALQGPLIFLLLVVFRKRVIKGLSEKGWLYCIPSVVERHLTIGDDVEDVVQHTTQAV